MAGGNNLGTFAVNGLSEYGGGGCSVSSVVVGFAGDFFHHLSAHVLKFVFEFDFLGHGDTVFGDHRSAEGFLDNDVTAFGPKGHFDGVRQSVYSSKDRIACVFAESQFFCRHLSLLN